MQSAAQETGNSRKFLLPIASYSTNTVVRWQRKQSLPDLRYRRKSQGWTGFLGSDRPSRSSALRSGLNIRLSSKDLEAIQKRALAEGLPSQTLISSLLHKYATGRLKQAG